jgi:hypothetical protein
VFVGVTVGFCYQSYIAKRLFRPLPAYVSPPALPRDFIKKVDATIKSQSEFIPVESVVWLNALLQWALLHLAPLPRAREAVRKCLAEGMFDALRIPMLGGFVGALVVEDFSLGSQAVEVSNIRELNLKRTAKKEAAQKEASTTSPLLSSEANDMDEGAPLVLTTNVRYNGPLTILVSAQMILGARVAVEFQVEHLEGPLCLVVRQRDMHFAFTAPPQISCQIDMLLALSSVKNGIRLPWFNQLLSKHIIPWILSNYAFTSPNFIGLWYRDIPDQPPYPWSSIVVDHDAQLLYSWQPAQRPEIRAM